MHGSLASVGELLDGLRLGYAADAKAELAVFPPYVFIPETAQRLANSGIAWGAQSVAEQASGAYTGEVAGPMLRDFGCTYVLVGHSERRSLYGESDAVVAAKFAAAQQHGLIPVLCVGETLEEREQGVTELVIARQLQAVLERVGISAFAQAVVAYEPVWAIGTGRTASPEQAQAVHAFIRGQIATLDATIANSLRVLYGGSMKAANAAELLAMPDIDGGLVGGASLQAQEFLAIANAA